MPKLFSFRAIPVNTESFKPLYLVVFIALSHAKPLRTFAGNTLTSVLKPLRLRRHHPVHWHVSSQDDLSDDPNKP
ncbi:hypothetical protein F9K82_07350 [Brucella pseudogrignonensis]|nr:hypothetical protein F9K82_07350 [Brucella pseudogrignonensis]